MVEAEGNVNTIFGLEVSVHKSPLRRQRVVTVMKGEENLYKDLSDPVLVQGRSFRA